VSKLTTINRDAVNRQRSFIHKVGTDLVEVSRIENLLRENEALQQSVFTQEELRYSRRKHYPFQHFAARFAAKEAVFKALGTGLSGDLDWRDVEVRNERSGKPILRLSGTTAIKANDFGMVDSFVSMSHTEQYAIALVLLVVRN